MTWVETFWRTKVYTRNTTYSVSWNAVKLSPHFTHQNGRTLLLISEEFISVSWTIADVFVSVMCLARLQCTCLFLSWTSSRTSIQLRSKDEIALFFFDIHSSLDSQMQIRVYCEFRSKLHRKLDGRTTVPCFYDVSWSRYTHCVRQLHFMNGACVVLGAGKGHPVWGAKIIHLFLNIQYSMAKPVPRHATIQNWVCWTTSGGCPMQHRRKNMKLRRNTRNY